MHHTPIKLISSDVKKHKLEQFLKMGTDIKKIFSLFFILYAFTSQSVLFPQVPVKDEVLIQSGAVMRLDKVTIFISQQKYDNKKS
jgi:hypothetical protein